VAAAETIKSFTAKGFISHTTNKRSGEMYVYIFEDGQIKTASTFDDDDMASCDMGVIDVIDISGEKPKQYHNNNWHDLESADDARTT